MERQETQKPEIVVELDSGNFRDADLQAVEEALEPYFRPSVTHFSDFSGGPVEPHVVVEVMGAVLPLADVYVGVISAALYDVIRSAFSGARRENTEVRFEVLLKDDDGRTAGYVEGRTSNEEVVKELLRRGSNAALRAPTDR